ncbi:glycosyltransferase family 2 protein [Aciduricibacillus chroicocephali]|uniref:Glycosyltransferase family 2 protein n=1 Tax=Aciduricibacillus chroicocephali TaxID=3054939 RepID=A0ABY9KTT2_9BACI|nr:glycosyltransferase family 2 protein [Bacillaceae bacterium 44XB]
MALLSNKLNYMFMDKEKFLKRIKYNNEGYYIHYKIRGDYKVTVVMPVYNAEQTIARTIDSIIAQTIGFENIQLLIIDDLSTDSSREIILDYSKDYPNIFPVFLKENSGSPATPRNLGIQLATGKYITFIDSDDWFHGAGIEVLYNLLEKTNDQYAVGKTIKVDDKGEYIIGEYNNWADRESIDPYSIDRIFHHLGPTARMMNTAFLQERNIQFPNMKFAEDKQFFIDVITQCKTISTSKEIIYYANRYSDNMSLTTTTTIFEKTDTNISLINYVKRKNLPVQLEKMVLNRLYEFDCITRLFDRGHFLRSTEKEKYYEKFQEVLDTTKDLRYEFLDSFYEPWHKRLIELFRMDAYDDLVKLIEWNRNVSTKDFYIENSLPYYHLPLNKIKSARINMLALHHATITESDRLLLQYRIYGDFKDEIQTLVFRQRHNDLNELEFPIKFVGDNLYETSIPYEHISKIGSASYSVYIKYRNYMKLPVRMNSREIIKYDEKKLDFYVTVSDNFGFTLK